MSRIHVQRFRWRPRRAVASLLAILVLLAAVWWLSADREQPIAATPAPAPTHERSPTTRSPTAAPSLPAPGKKRVEPLPPRAPPFIEGLDGNPHRYTLRDGAVSAFADERGLAVALTDGEQAGRMWGLRWSVAGARRVRPAPAGDPLPGVVNDLRGEAGRQRTGLRTYDRLVYRELFDGVDLEVEPRVRGLEYTFRVAAGAAVPELRFLVDGARSLAVEDGGEALAIETGVGRLKEGKLAAYQDGPDGVRREVPVRYAYARKGSGELGWEYGLEVGPHDPSLPLVIDPTLAWSTYLGASTGDLLFGMAVDTAGNRYLTGYTVSVDYPIVGGFDSTLEGPNDAFITKIGGGGDNIIWSTLYGGNDADQGLDIAVDSSSNVYVVGATGSTNLTIVGGFQGANRSPSGNKTDAFVMKIAASGASIIWSSYLGGDGDDTGEAMALDSSQNVYLTGSTRSTDLLVVNAFQPAYGGGGGTPPDAWVARVNANGSSLSYLSYLGGSADDTAYDIAVSGSSAWVTGYTGSATFPVTGGAYDTSLSSQDAFLTKVSASGTSIVWSTLLGGSGNERGVGVAVDGSLNAYVGGNTSSVNFPIAGGFQATNAGGQDQFAARIDPNGANLLWSSYLGGGGNDTTHCLELDAVGQLFIGGETTSSNYPLVGGPFDTTYNGTSEGIIARINAGGGALGWSSYLGGGADEHVLSLGWDNSGVLYAAGYTNSADFPIVGGFDNTFGGSQDGFVARIAGSGAVPPSASGPTKLAFITAPQTVTAGTCSAATTVQSQDASSMPANVTANTTVTLAASPSIGFTFYSDPGCNTVISSVLIAAGGNSATFYWRGNAAGSVTVSADAPGLATGTQVETINPAAAALLAFTTLAQTVAAGSCSAVATVQRRDTFGNPVTGGSTTVNLSASPAAGFTFYSDPACGTVATSFTIGAGASSGNFYFRGTAAGSVTVTASATGLTSGTQVETITAGAASVLAFTTAPQTVTAGSCSAIATVQRRDASGNPVTSGSTTVNLSASPAAGFIFYSDPACGTVATSFVIGAGASSGSFYFLGTTAGSVTVTAAAAGLTSGTQVETIVAGTATVLAFTTAPQTVAAGACSAVATVQRRDALGNPVSTGSTTVLLSVSPTTGFTFYSDPACGTSASSFTINAGSSTGNFYFRGTVAGSFSVTAASAGFVAAIQTETITAGAASVLVFTTSPQSVGAGACSAVATVQRRDASGNPVTSGSTTVSLSASPAAGFTFYSDPACGTVASSFTINAGSSTGNFYFRGTAVGSVTVTASAAGLTSGTQVETITAGAATALAFTTSAQTVAAGACSAVATVERRDASGNPVTSGSTTVNLSASPAAGFTFYSDPACGTAASSFTINAGASTGNFYFRGTAVGPVTVTASASGLTSATQVETITAGAASVLAFTTTPQTVAAGSCSGIATVQRRDASGNPVTSGSTTVSLSAAPGGSFTFYSDPACGTVAASFTIGAGASSGSFYFRGTAAGSITVTASAAGLTSGTQVETITAGPAAALVYTTVGQTVAAGSCSGVVTVLRQDNWGNTVTAGTTTVTLSASPPAGFTFYSDPACGTVSSSFTINPGASTGSFYFRGTTAGTVTVTAASTGLLSAIQNHTITAGSASALAFTTSAQTVTAGACSAVATVQRRDGFGNPVTAGSTTVNLSASPAAGFTFYSDAACGTVATSFVIGAGASSGNFYFRGTAAGPVTVTASAAGLTSATQVETINPAAAAALAFTSAPQTIGAGTCSAAATVQRRDAFGNAVSTGATTVNLSASPAAGFTFYSDPACGTAATSFTIGAGSSSGSFYFRGASAGSYTVTASAAGLTSATQVETISAGAATVLAFTTAPQTLAHRSCSAVVTVQTRDGSGNPAPVGAPTALAFSSPTGTMTFFADPGCGTALSSPTIPGGGSTFSLYFRDTGVGAKTMDVGAAGFTGASQTHTLTNTAPVANAGVDQSQGEAKVVTLNASASIDAENDPLTYQWTQTGGPAVTLSSTTAAQPTFTTPTVFVPTPLLFRLVVNDGFVASAPDTVQVTVNNDVNEPPVASAGPDLNTKSGNTFTLDGTGSSDPNGTPVTYLWTQVAGPAMTLADPTTSTQALVAPLVATSTTFVFQLVVNDGSAPSAPDTATVVVGPPDFPVITSVARKLTATGVAYQYDPDSTVEATGLTPMTFSVVQGPPGFAISATGVVSYTPSAAGSFPIRIRATNSAGTGEQAYSLKVVSAPVITSSARTTGSPFVPYLYDADGLPAAVGTPTIGWSLVQAPPGAVVVHDTGEVLWTPLESGPAPFKLRASNAFGYDDQAFTVQVGAATPPVIDATANLNAQVGRPYVYDADGRVGVQPAGIPVAVESGPAGFRVDPLTAEVSWLPLSAGVFPVQLVAGVAPLRSPPYAFQITVVDLAATPPTAVAGVSPAAGGAPLDVRLDGLSSTAASGRTLMLFEWEPGDGSPPVSAPVVNHRYEAPGGYTPELVVADELGQTATATASVQVGLGSVLPPTAQLSVEGRQTLPDGSLSVTLRCQCADPQGQPLSYFWELGDGTTSDLSSPTHAYRSYGTFRAQLTVSNATLSTRASIDVVVQRGSDVPPEVRAYASPVRGRAPLQVQLTSSARDQDGYILRREWTFPDDGNSSDLPSVNHRFDSPGVYQVAFQATDDDGLTSTDRVEVVVLAVDGTQPPKFVSMGSQQAQVGAAYEYDADGKPSVSGDAPIAFTLESPPEGATIDGQMGAVSWTPRDSGVARLVITATNSAGSASQVLLVQVQPLSREPPGPCGCGEAGGASAAAAAGLLLVLLARARRGTWKLQTARRRR